MPGTVNPEPVVVEDLMQRFIAVVSLVLLTTGMAFAKSEYPMVDVVEKVSSSVVSIDANRVTYGGVTGAGALEYSQYQYVLTDRLTGFIYTDNGYIITEQSGLGDAEILTVVLADGTELPAELIGSDDQYGVAVLKVNSDEPLPKAEVLAELYDPYDNSFPYDQGDAVLAIGYSGGYGGTVTFGIVSNVRNIRNRNGILIPNMIQADVAINAGNQGCPLFNEAGQIIGYHDRVSGLQNITFFLPMWLVTRVADEIIFNHETQKLEDHVWQPWLGIKTYSGSLNPFTGGMRQVDPQLKMFMDLPDQYWDIGVLLDAVWIESPAREFGLQEMDMLMSVTVLRGEHEDVYIDYEMLKDIERLELLVSTAQLDDVFVFGVLRFTDEDPYWLNVEVVVGQRVEPFPGINEYF